MSKRAFVLLLFAACGGREERAPVSRPSPPASALAPAPASYAPEPERPIGFDVKESDVVVTGGFGAAKDRFLRPGDPKPGDPVEMVRFTCEMGKTCTAAASFGEAIEQRFAQCFVLRSRAPTAKEIANVDAAMNHEKGPISVPDGRIFAVERRHTRKEEVMEALECPKNTRGRHPCDPAMVPTGRFVEKVATDRVAIGPRGSDVSVPFRTWKLRWIELTRMPGPLEAVDVSTQPVNVRAAILFDRAVEAVRSKDRARVLAAVKALEAGVTIAEGMRIEDQTVPRSVATAIVVDLPIIRAVGEGRATVGDACKR